METSPDMPPLSASLGRRRRLTLASEGRLGALVSWSGNSLLRPHAAKDTRTPPPPPRLALNSSLPLLNQSSTRVNLQSGKLATRRRRAHRLRLAST
jgi:hypothetical protein